MAGVWMATTGALAVLIVVLASVLLRLRSRVTSLEARLASSDANVLPETDFHSTSASLDDEPAGYLITRMGAEVDDEAPVRVDAALFTDQLARESAVQLASLAHGLRRALSAETRHRIRFHMHQEVKRVRKQRRVEMRIAHREWTARQRSAADHAA